MENTKMFCQGLQRHYVHDSLTSGNQDRSASIALLYIRGGNPISFSTVTFTGSLNEGQSLPQLLLSSSYAMGEKIHIFSSLQLENLPDCKNKQQQQQDQLHIHSSLCTLHSAYNFWSKADKFWDWLWEGGVTASRTTWPLEVWPTFSGF